MGPAPPGIVGNTVRLFELGSSPEQKGARTRAKNRRVTMGQRVASGQSIEPLRFMQADRDYIAEMGSAILKLHTEVASLQRDLLAAEAGVLKRVDAHKSFLERSVAVSRDDVIKGLKFEITDTCQLTKHLRGASGDAVLQPLVEDTMK